MQWIHGHRRLITTIGFIAVAVGTGVVSRSQADESTMYLLRSRHQPASTDDVAITYTVGGTLIVPGDRATEKLPMKVNAALRYQDRLLASDRIEASSGEAADEAAERVHQRGVRFYDHVDVKIQINGRDIVAALRDDRRLVGVGIKRGRVTLFSPRGPLTREELDLIHLPGDSRITELLLPDRPIRVGSTWQHDSSALAMLLGLDAVGDSDVTSELIEVKGRYAKVELNGTVHGATSGLATEIVLKARYYFDIRRGRLTSLQLVTKERRDIGYVAPGVDVTARLKLTVTPRTRDSNVSDDALVGLQLERGHRRDHLLYQSSLLGVAFQHDRHWHVTADDSTAAVLRRVDRGELVAQCNVSRLPKIKKGKEISLSQFQQDIRKSLDKNFGAFVSAGETSNESGQLVYRVEAAGTTSGLPVRWIYYLLADSEGRRAALVFTMESELAKQFGVADRPIVASLALVQRDKAQEPELAEPRPETADNSPARGGRTADSEDRGARKSSAGKQGAAGIRR